MNYGRQRHQQQLLKALTAKVTTSHLLTNPIATDRMLRALGNRVTFDGNGAALTDWILAFRHLDAADVTVFDAMRTATVSDFLTAHPDWVSR